MSKYEKESMEEAERARARYFRRQREKASESEMKRRAKEEEKTQKDFDPNGLYQDGSTVSHNDSALYHVELNNKVILIKKPQVDHMQGGYVIKSVVNEDYQTQQQ